MSIRPALHLIIGVDDLKTDPKDRFEIIDPRARRYVEFRRSGYWEELSELEVQERSNDYLHNRYRLWDKVDESFYQVLKNFNQTECSNYTPKGYKTRTYEDILCWYLEYGLPNVVGVYLPCQIGNETHYYDKYFLWMMSAAGILPKENAVFVIPEIPWCETLEGRYLWQTILKGVGNEKLSPSNRYLIEHARIFPYYGSELTRDFELAWLILKRCGFDFDYEDLKLMVYFNWC